MNKVCMIVLNDFKPDVRVQKEAETLVNKGYQVLVIALKNLNNLENEFMRGFEVQRIKVGPRGKLRHPFFQLGKAVLFWSRAYKKIKSFQPDVIHAHNLNALLGSCVLAKILRAKLIYDSHEYWTGYGRSTSRKRILGIMIDISEPILINCSDAVITINQSIAEKLSEKYNIDTPTVIMNAHPRTRVVRNNDIRALLNVPERTKLVIYAAGFRPNRGLRELIYSSEFLSKDIMIVLMGPDLMGGELQKLVKDNGYSNVRFLAPVEADQVTEFIASANLGIIPVQSVTDNSYYGLGNKIFHYIAAGLPIAVSNQPERRMLVEKYNIGIVFDEKDPRDIAMKIHKMLENEEEYQLTRTRVREAYISDLNWEKEAEKLINLYKSLN